jgi:hypothetical protein
MNKAHKKLLSTGQEGERPDNYIKIRNFTK